MANVIAGLILLALIGLGGATLLTLLAPWVAFWQALLITLGVVAAVVLGAAWLRGREAGD